MPHYYNVVSFSWKEKNGWDKQGYVVTEQGLKEGELISLKNQSFDSKSPWGTVEKGGLPISRKKKNV